MGILLLIGLFKKKAKMYPVYYVTGLTIIPAWLKGPFNINIIQLQSSAKFHNSLHLAVLKSNFAEVEVLYLSTSHAEVCLFSINKNGISFLRLQVSAVRLPQYQNTSTVTESPSVTA